MSLGERGGPASARRETPNAAALGANVLMPVVAVAVAVAVARAVALAARALALPSVLPVLPVVTAAPAALPAAVAHRRRAVRHARDVRATGRPQTTAQHKCRRKYAPYDTVYQRSERILITAGPFIITEDIGGLSGRPPLRVGLSHGTEDPAKSPHV